MPLSLLSQSHRTCQCIVQRRTLDTSTITWATCGFLEIYGLPSPPPQAGGRIKIAWESWLEQIASLTDRHLIDSMLFLARQTCTINDQKKAGWNWVVTGERLDEDHVLLSWQPAPARSIDVGRAISYDVLYSLPNPVFIKDQDHRWVYGNAAFYELFCGREPSSVLGKSDYDFFPQEQAQQFWAMDEMVLEQQRSITVEEPVTTADGREKWLLTQKLPIELPGGGQGVLGIISDITKIKVAEQQRELNREFRQKLEKADESKSRFLTNMSHELRTPLNAVIGYTELIQDDFDMLSEEEVREDLAKVSAAAHHLLDLVNGVLDISRAQSGKFVLSYEHVELGALFRNVAHYIHSMVNHDACTFSVQTPPQPVWGEVDIMRLRQVILNLLSNAVKFTERGSIATRLWVEEDDFLVEVVDTGPGITQDKWLTIFEPFERLDMHNSLIDGTGLGLSLSRHLAHLMGGDIGLHSVPHQGSTFTLRLPLSRAQTEEPKGQEETTEASLAEPRRLDLPTVLVIDDDPSVHELIARFAAQQPVEVLWAADPIQGCKVALDHDPSLILLDLVFPGVCGWDILERLRADPRTAKIPVVVVSFLAHQGSETPAQSQTPRVQKPLSRNTWNELLKTHLPQTSQCA